MKKVLTTSSFFVLGLLGIFYVCTFFVDAHSGRTDSRDGHYNRFPKTFLTLIPN